MVDMDLSLRKRDWIPLVGAFMREDEVYNEVRRLNSIEVYPQRSLPGKIADHTCFLYQLTMVSVITSASGTALTRYVLYPAFLKLENLFQ